MKLKVSKVDLEGLLTILTDLWEKGVDFIDIELSEDNDKRIAVFFQEDYLSKDAKISLDNEPTDIKDIDNINDLI